MTIDTANPPAAAPIRIGHTEVAVRVRSPSNTLDDRIKRVCALRHALAEDPNPFIDAIDLSFRRTREETVASELLPLADACLFLEKNARRLLRPRRLGARGLPIWLWGVDAEIRREPVGRVLIIGPQNYPLMIPGIQVIQALVAGNQVLLKPAPGTRAVALVLANTLHRLGVSKDDLTILDESPAAAQAWLGQVDKVVLTGSAETGKSILRCLSDHLTPSVMELSGADAVIVLPDADLDLTAKCLVFGLRFNGSNSCIAPRRVFVSAGVADELVRRFLSLALTLPPLALGDRARATLNELGPAALRDGARQLLGQFPASEETSAFIFDSCNPTSALLQADVGAPLLCFVRTASLDESLGLIAFSKFRLGAAVFGSPVAARAAAEALDVGGVVINDVIVPTADPRLPFGGRGQSGFGVTRGGEGLLEMTQAKTISLRRRGPRFHLMPPHPRTERLILAQLQALHGRGLIARLRGWRRFFAIARQFKNHESPPMQDQTS